MKDHKTFLAAMQQLPELRAIVVGADTETLKAPKNVQCLGLQTEMPRLYAAADFVISTSAFGEGCSNVLAEGMACGLPPIATEVGDAAAIVGDVGVLVSPRDPKALAAAIRTLATEPIQTRKGRSARARAHIVQHFSLRDAVARYNNLYGELVSAMRQLPDVAVARNYS
jgi:glycosyltransferase involved in cell wall biosynthesis